MMTESSVDPALVVVYSISPGVIVTVLVGFGKEDVDWNVSEESEDCLLLLFADDVPSETEDWTLVLVRTLVETLVVPCIKLVEVIFVVCVSGPVEVLTIVLVLGVRTTVLLDVLVITVVETALDVGDTDVVSDTDCLDVV